MPLERRGCGGDVASHLDVPLRAQARCGIEGGFPPALEACDILQTGLAACWFCVPRVCVHLVISGELPPGEPPTGFVAPLTMARIRLFCPFKRECAAPV
jgi:hypothetical protein